MTALTIEQKNLAVVLLAKHNEWREERADLSVEEESGRIPEWADSDDAGCDLADRLAELLRTITAEPTIPAATGHRDCLQCDATLGDTATECWQCKKIAEQEGEPYEPDLGDPYLVCTSCKTADSIHEDERATRWSPVGHRDHGSTTLADDGTVHVAMDYDGSGDFDGEGYVCEGAVGVKSHPVTIPANWNLGG